MDQTSAIHLVDTGFIYAVFYLPFSKKCKLQCFNPLCQFFLIFFRFRSPLAIDYCFPIHSIARIWPIIRAHMVFIVRSWYLLYFIHSMLSVMQLIGYRSTILKCGLITDSALQIVFFRLISTGAI